LEFGSQFAKNFFVLTNNEIQLTHILLLALLLIGLCLIH